MKRTSLVFLCLLFATSSAQARYIDYPGGWTVMQMNDGENNSLHAHYTVESTYSLGYGLDYWRDGEWTEHTGELSVLLKRWNFDDAQANFMWRGGAGVAHGDVEGKGDEIEPAAFSELEFDAENRRYYVSYANKYTEAGDFYDGFEQKARVGFAPYIGEYGALHTWLMLQVDHRPEFDDTFSVTPLIRVFKGDILVEFGVSDSKEILFNVMARF